MNRLSNRSKALSYVPDIVISGHQPSSSDKNDIDNAFLQVNQLAPWKDDELKRSGGIRSSQSLHNRDGIPESVFQIT